MINNKYKNILVDFDFLGDTDLTVCEYVIYNYKDSFYLNKDILHSSEYYLKYILITRDNKNPLTVIFKDKYKDKLDDLYKELIDTKWEDILKHCKNTDIYSVFHMTDYNIYVNCRNEAEVEMIYKQTKDKFKCIINCIDCTPYFSIYCKNAEDIFKRKNINGKSIYIQDYGPNYENQKNDVPNSAALALMGKNNLKFISIYSDITKDFN